MSIRTSYAQIAQYLAALGVVGAGSTVITGTLGVSGNVAVATNKFTVTAASGNTLVAGTLNVTGATTLASTLAVTGNVAVNTDKFTVAASSGNTLVAGTLAVTGAATITGDIDAAGGFPLPFGPFVQDNVAANQSAVVVKLGATGATVVDGVAPRAGSLRGIVASFTVAPAGTDLVVSVLKNGTLIHATGILTVTAGATLGRTVTFTKDNANLLFAAGDRIGVTVTTGAGWTATTSDMAVFVIVEG